MGTRHTLYRAIFTPVVVDVPDHCPGCGADFTAVGALVEGNWVDGCVASHLEGGVAGEGTTEFGDTYYPVGLLCAACDSPLPGTAEDVR